MGQRNKTIRIELKEKEHLEFREWAGAEDRSTRRHCAVLVRRLTALRRTNPDDLRRLGLVGREEPATV